MGDYLQVAMEYSYSEKARAWKAVDGGSWWLRDTKYGEPIGDYHANCWLGMSCHTCNDYAFNDMSCGYSTTKYLCSTNDKDDQLKSQT